MGRPLKIKQSSTIDIGFNPFNLLDQPTVVIPAGMQATEYLGVVGGGFPVGSGIATPAYPTVNVSAYMPNGLSTDCTIITQKGQYKYLIAGSDTVNDGSLTVGFSYIIRSVGTTNWTAIGAGVNPQVGDIFTATGTGTGGNGTAADVAQCILTPVDNGTLTAGQMNISFTTNGGTVYASRLTNKYVWDQNNNRYAANFFVAGGNGTTTIAGAAVTGIAGQFSCTATELAVNQQVVISGTQTGTASITGYTAPGPQTYYIIATNGTTTFTLSDTLGGAAIVTTAGTIVGLSLRTPTPNNLAGVAITGIAGQFSCTATTIALGQPMVISGTLTGTGSITGYTAPGPQTYYVVTTNGSTTFTLSASPAGAAIVTTAGTTVGLTFSMPNAYTAKSGAEIATWTNGTGNLALADVSQENT